MTHPSLPNYLALVSGSTHGITSDCTRCTVAGRSLADTLEARHLTWKTYAEGLPRPGWTGPSRGRYAKRHVPFLYFRRVLSSPARLRRIVPLTQLARDRAAGKLPNFALVVPDFCHDMHDCSVATGDAWLKRFLPPLLKLPGTAVFVVFDESDSADARVPALALGPLVRPHSRATGPLGHYCAPADDRGWARAAAAGPLGAGDSDHRHLETAARFRERGIRPLALKLCARGDADGADRGDRGA